MKRRVEKVLQCSWIVVACTVALKRFAFGQLKAVRDHPEILLHALPSIPVVSKPQTFTHAQWHSTGVSWSVATALASFPFLGMLGLDRMLRLPSLPLLLGCTTHGRTRATHPRRYMGYPVLGLLKFATGGGFFAWAWLDLVLISTQAIGPADGSHWDVGTHGQRFFTVGDDPIPPQQIL